MTTDTMMNEEKLIKKVQKLLALLTTTPTRMRLRQHTQEHRS